VIVLTFPLLPNLLFKINLVVCYTLALLIIYIISILLKSKNKKQNLLKERQLEQLLMALSAYLYSNTNVFNCIEKAVNDINNPLKKEFEIVINENRHGILLNDCLKNLIKRNNSKVIETVILGFIAANDKGLDLVSFINLQIEYIREKRYLKNYIDILSSGPKYTSYLIIIIPILSILIIILLNDNYIDMLLSGIGLAVLLYSTVSYILGIFLINKLINTNKFER